MSQYKNYGAMRRARKKLFKASRLICKKCQIKPASLIHHKDFSKSNHKITNLTILCRSCHIKFHTENGDFFSHKSIFYKGKTFKEWAKILNIKPNTLYERYKKYGNFTSAVQSGRKIYGLTFREIGEKLNITKQRAHQLHKENQLKKRLIILTR